MTYREIFRQADLIAKRATYHGVKMVKLQKQKNEVTNNLDKWFRGKK